MATIHKYVIIFALMKRVKSGFKLNIDPLLDYKRKRQAPKALLPLLEKLLDLNFCIRLEELKLLMLKDQINGTKSEPVTT